MLARAIAVGMALVALGAAGPAMGGGGEPQAFKGSFTGAGEISFRLERASSRTVDRITITGISAECRSGSAELDYAIHGETSVLHDRTFAVRSEDGTGGKALVKGRFSRRFKRAKGTARVYGKFFDGSARCDSEKQKFAAR